MNSVSIARGERTAIRAPTRETATRDGGDDGARDRRVASRRDSRAIASIRRDGIGATRAMAREDGALTPRDTNRIARDGDVEFAWEHAKENVQPARRGRDGCALRDALRATTRGGDREAEAREATRAKMWAAATRARGADDDALGAWCGLIKWTEQTYATGNGRERELLPVLERCTREMQEVEAYKEDARYLRVWIKYADCCAEPGDIFKFLKANAIGQRQALYYEAYGAFLEVRQAYGAANEQYERGIEMRAEPLERLRASYAAFQHRMVRRTQKRIESGEIDENEGEEIVRNFGDTLKARSRSGGGVSSRRGESTTGARQARGGLSGPTRGATQSTPQAQTSNAQGNVGGLDVYDDAENGAPTPGEATTTGRWKNLGGYKDVRKENTAQATTWAGQRATQSKRKVTVPSDEIAVFEDTECLKASDVKAATAATERDVGSLRQRVDGEVDLSRNPMLYHSGGQPPLAPGERPKSKYRGFKPAHLRSEDGEELCYEEIRAAAWVRANGPTHKPRTTAEALVELEPTMEMDMDVDMDGNVTEISGDLPQLATQATRDHATSLVKPAKAAKDDEIVSKRTYVAPPPPVGSRTGSCASEPSEAGSVISREKSPQAKRPALVNKVRAGARWTADEEGTRAANHDPTMTICTKEAWGDIMSLFSDSVAVGEGGYDADLSGAEGLAAANAKQATQQPKPAEEDDCGLCIREDTCVLSKEMLAARLAESRKPMALDHSEDGGLFIREDTVAIPSNLGELSIREDTECLPKLASMTVTPASNASRPARRPLGLRSTPNTEFRESTPRISSMKKRPALAQLQLINPFNAEALDEHLNSLELCVENDVYIDLKSSRVETLSAAAKCVSKSGKRAAAGVSVTLGDVSFVFKGRVGEGAHAEVYEAELESKARVSSEEDVGAYALKVQEARYAKWEFVVARRLLERLPAEASAAVNWAQPTALHLLGGREHDGNDATMGVLVMPFGEHGTLQDVLNSYLREGKQMHETLVMYYAVEMLRLVEWIHGAGIVHADLKPDNLLLRNGGDDWCDWAPHRPGSWTEKGLALIDFGRAIDLLMYPEEAAFVGDAGAEAFRCIEMMQGKPWTYQADCYAIASTIHCLLYGSYMEVELAPGTTNAYRQRQPLRRYWKTELWEVVFDRLLNQPTESTPPPLGSLRSLLEEHMRDEGQNIRKLLMHQTIDMYQQIRDGKVK